MFERFSGKRERVRREAADWLVRLQDQPGVRLREGFRRWYDADPLNAETFDRIKAIYGSAGRLAQTELGRSRGLPEASEGRVRLPPYAVAAGLVALLVSGAVLLGRPEALMPRAEAETLVFATRVGEIREVSLPDGSRLTLDAKSAVRVNVGGRLRQVILSEGRARFAVAREARRTFVVEAGSTQVSGQAATFDVGLIGGEVIVQPIEGTLSLEISGAGVAAAPVRLIPGQVVRVPAEGGPVQARPARSAAALWPTGRLEFVGTPLGEVVAEANRYSRGRISLADPALSRLRVTGTFRAGDLEGLARSLEQALMLRLDRTGTEQFVLHPRTTDSEPIRR
jgi:transmembrane sensor